MSGQMMNEKKEPELLPLRELIHPGNFGMTCHARRPDGSKCPNKAWLARGNELFCREHAPK
jgi:hypothetical protein